MPKEQKKSKAYFGAKDTVQQQIGHEKLGQRNFTALNLHQNLKSL